MKASKIMDDQILATVYSIFSFPSYDVAPKYKLNSASKCCIFEEVKGLR
jgi:hypothetical protein